MHFIKCNIGSFFVYKNPNSVIKKFNLRVNSCSVFRIQFISMKLFLLLSLLFVTSLPIYADTSLYERGKDLIEEKDYEKALKAFELAAKNGDLDAMHAVGIMYIGGWGIEQNDKKGIGYIIKAANQSHLKAQYTLGAMYYLGIGVPLDFEKAFSWISLSANQGYLDAQHNLAEMFENGKGVKKNLEKAYQYYLSAARKGNLDSQKKVAEMYKEGIGTEKNIEKSEYWLRKIEESAGISQ